MEKKKLDISRDTRQNLIIIGVLLLAIIIFSSISKYFLKWDNIVAILVAAVPLGLVAISESNCLMVGGFDMSVLSAVTDDAGNLFRLIFVAFVGPVTGSIGCVLAVVMQRVVTGVKQVLRIVGNDSHK